MPEAIMEVLNWINDMILGMTTEGSALTEPFGKFMSTVFEYTETIMEIVVMPAAYVILALFFVLELHKASQRTEGMGGSATLSAQIIFKILLKLVLCKAVVDEIPTVLGAIFDVSTHLTKGIGGVIADETLSGGIDVLALQPVLEGLSFWTGLVCLIISFIVFIIVMLAVVFANVIIYARFIELYIYFAISPIPIATLPSDEMSQIGKSFLKSFAAVCIQGTLIFLVLSIFPVLFNEALLNFKTTLGLFGALMGVLAYSLVLILAVFSTGKWAKALCNAI